MHQSECDKMLSNIFLFLVGAFLAIVIQNIKKHKKLKFSEIVKASFKISSPIIIGIIVTLIGNAIWIAIEALSDPPIILKVQPYDSILADANQAMIDQDFLSAVKLYSSVINQDQNNLPSYIGRGTAYNELKLFPNAIIDFSKAIQLDPSASLAYAGRGDSYREESSIPDAVKNYTRAIELEPHSVRFLHKRAFLFKQNGNYPRAIKDFMTLLELEYSPEILYELSECYKQNSDSESALYYIDKAISESTDSYSLWRYYNCKVEILADDGQYDKALSVCNYYISQNPSESKGYEIRADFLVNYNFNEDTIKQALSDYQQAINFEKWGFTVSFIYRKIGEVYLKIEEYEDAIDNFTKAIDLDSTQSSRSYSLSRRAHTYVLMEDFGPAIEDYSTVIGLQDNAQDKSFYLSKRGYAFFCNNDYLSTLKDADAAIKLDSNSSEAYNLLGMTYKALDNYPESLKNYNVAISLDPNSSSLYWNKTLLFEKMEDYESAIKCIKIAIEIEPDNSSYKERLSHLLSKWSQAEAVLAETDGK